MTGTTLIDELHLTVRVPADLNEADRATVYRTLAGDAFLDRLQDAIAAVVLEFPALAPAAVALSR